MFLVMRESLHRKFVRLYQDPMRELPIPWLAVPQEVRTRTRVIENALILDFTAKARVKVNKIASRVFRDGRSSIFLSAYRSPSMFH